MKNELVIVIPTYNERENIEEILSQILVLELPADILFIDDNSPDGTGQLLKGFVNRYNNVYSIHRSEKLGIGSAHVEGINWAYDQGYNMLITMDGDLSHSPDYISELISKANESDVIVGSRYLNKKSISTWNYYRKFLTRIGHLATKVFLSMPYDATGAFRLYRLDKISRYFLNSVISKKYSFFFESLYVLYVNGYNINEISVELPDRVYGHSKMKYFDIIDSLSRLLLIKLSSLIDYQKYEIVEPIGTELINEETVDKQGWDSYWIKKNKPSLIIYDVIALIYRKLIIKPSLKYYIKKNFNEKSNLLHAGCGSGQVDVEVGKLQNITAMDISVKALNIYKKYNKNYYNIIHGSILDIPISGKSYDGIYNLGVMEHFNEDEIITILIEFNRVLKSKGKIILFWPPEFGLSVIFLKVIHYCLNELLNQKVKFHPPEISRLKSRYQIIKYFKKTGFVLEKYSFGLRDIFTYVVIVGQKI